MTSIFKAVYENNVETIKQFIADANRTTPSSKDPQAASQSARKKSNVPMVNINKRSILGRTALHLAASWNRANILQLLVDCPHANVNIRDRENGWTALHRLVKKKRPLSNVYY
jgi:ankyrin repeat protein